MPPLLGLELIAHARAQFTDHELRRLFRGIAKAVIEDAQDRKRAVSLILQSLAAFVVRRKTLRKLLEAEEIEGLIDQGLLRPFQPRSGEPLLVVRHSELLASEIADILGEDLASRAPEDPGMAADWIAGAAGNFPLGDIVAAQAICDAAMKHGGLPINLIVSLLETPPKRHAVNPGTRSAMYFPGLGTFDMTFKEGGAIAVEVGGQQHTIEPDPGEEEHVSYSDFHPWLILSYLAGVPFIAGNDLKDRSARIDPALLLEVGACAIVLRRPGGNPDVVSVLTHEISGVGSIVCHKEGIVEAITWSMFRYLSDKGPSAAEWVHAAVERNSLPLLARVDIALRHVAGTADPIASTWARQMLETVVWPAFRELPPLHPESEGAG